MKNSKDRKVVQRNLKAIKGIRKIPTRTKLLMVKLLSIIAVLLINSIGKWSSKVKYYLIRVNKKLDLVLNNTRDKLVKLDINSDINSDTDMILAYIMSITTVVISSIISIIAVVITIWLSIEGSHIVSNVFLSIGVVLFIFKKEIEDDDKTLKKIATVITMVGELSSLLKDQKDNNNKK